MYGQQQIDDGGVATRGLDSLGDSTAVKATPMISPSKGSRMSVPPARLSRTPDTRVHLLSEFTS